MIFLGESKLDELLLRDQPMFINRMGGSDAHMMFNHYKHGKKGIDGPIEAVIKKISVMNGYYDLSKDPIARRKNVNEFFSQIDSCYRSNEYQSIITKTVSDNPQYYKDLKVSYFCYHSNFERTNKFLSVLEKVSKGKTVLIINPFTDEIKKQIPKLKSLYSGRINLDCNFKYVKAPITYFDLKKGYLNTPHTNFLETAAFLCNEIDKENYDIVLIGCGSYAHFLGEHIKKRGKKAVYIGGVLPSYFGLLSDRGIMNNAMAPYFDFNYVVPLVPTQKFSHTFDVRQEALSDYLFHRERHGHLVRVFNQCRLHLMRHVFQNKLSDYAALLFFIYHCYPYVKVVGKRKDTIEKLRTYVNQYNSNLIKPQDNLPINKLEAFKEYIKKYPKL